MLSIKREYFQAWSKSLNRELFYEEYAKCKHFSIMKIAKGEKGISYQQSIFSIVPTKRGALRWVFEMGESY